MAVTCVHESNSMWCGVSVTAVDESNIRKYQRLTGVFLFVILVGCLVGIIVPAGPGWDFANFYDTGRRVAAGETQNIYNPDSLIGGEKPQGHMRFWSAPLSAVFYVPLSYFSAPWALIIFKIENTLAYFAALALLYLHYRKFAGNSLLPQWQFAAVFTFLSLMYQPFWTVYRVGGQTTPTVFLLFSLALLSYTGGRFFVSALFLVLAVMIKPTFVTMLLFLAVISGIRFIKNTALVLLLAGLASLLVMGWQIHAEFLGVLREGVRTTFPWFYNSSLYVPIESLRMFVVPDSSHDRIDLAFTIITAGVKAFVVLTFVFIMIKSYSERWSDAARRHFSFLMAVCFCLLITQTVWEHYLSALFLLLAYVIAARQHFSRPAMILVGAVFFLALGQNILFIDFLRSHYNFDSLAELLFVGLFKSGPLILVLIFLSSHYKEIFRSYAGQGWTESMHRKSV